jgi:Tfp pilus assembly protein PilE
MASVKAYMAGLVVLVVVAVVFAILWFMAYTSYAGLEARYAKLQSQYNTLEANYTNLESNYNSLQSQYQTLQTQYSSLQSQYSGLQINYTTLQNQYNTLKTNYSELNNTYWELFTALGQEEWNLEWPILVELYSSYLRGWITAPANSTTASIVVGDSLPPDNYYSALVVVPSNFSAIINMMVNMSAPVDVYVFNLSNYVLWLEGYSPTYYFYAQGTYISGTVTVPGPGIYIVVLYNPSNTTTAEFYSWPEVMATFIQTSG